jgi:hypothetical protein
MGNRQELLDGGSFGGSAAFDNIRLASGELHPSLPLLFLLPW